MTDTEGFRAVRARREALSPPGSAADQQGPADAEAGHDHARRQVNGSRGVRDIHPGIGQLRGPGIPAGPSSEDGSHVPLGQRGKSL